MLNLSIASLAIANIRTFSPYFARVQTLNLVNSRIDFSFSPFIRDSSFLNVQKSKFTNFLSSCIKLTSEYYNKPVINNRIISNSIFDKIVSKSGAISCTSISTLISFSFCTIVNCQSTVSSAAISISNAEDITMTGMYFLRCSSPNGAAILIQNTDEVTCEQICMEESSRPISQGIQSNVYIISNIIKISSANSTKCAVSEIGAGGTIIPSSSVTITQWKFEECNGAGILGFYGAPPTSKISYLMFFENTAMEHGLLEFEGDYDIFYSTFVRNNIYQPFAVSILGLATIYNSTMDFEEIFDPFIENHNCVIGYDPKVYHISYTRKVSYTWDGRIVLQDDKIDHSIPLPTPYPEQTKGYSLNDAGISAATALGIAVISIFVLFLIFFFLRMYRRRVVHKVNEMVVDDYQKNKKQKQTIEQISDDVLNDIDSDDDLKYHLWETDDGEDDLRPKPQDKNKKSSNIEGNIYDGMDNDDDLRPIKPAAPKKKKRKHRVPKKA